MSGRRKRVVAGTGLTVGAAFGIAGPAHAIEVNDDGDPGVGVCDVTECTLREAIAEANANVDASVITFAAGLTGSTITLDPGIGYGRLVIDEPVDIQGLGADSLTVSGGDATGLFGVYPNTPDDDVTISGLTLTGGLVDDDDGGAIKSYDADLFVEDAVVTGNTAGAVGGAYDDEGGGGIAAENGTLTITDSTISQNRAPEEDGGGGGVLAQHVGLSLDGSTLSGNSADGEDGYGGGMFLVDTGASITGSTVSGNTALGGDEAAAGGIFTVGGPLGYSLEVVDSTISGNQTSGAAVYYGGAGAGLYAIDVLTSFDNSTLSGNTGNFYGGAIAARYGSLAARNSTIAGNTAYGGGGIAAAVITATLENTIVADNVATVGPDLVGDFDAAFSLIENATNPGSITATVPNSNLFGQDPLLAVLADNGGPDSGAPGMLAPIETQLPLGTSPAVDCGRSFGEIEDQRGEGRPVQLSPPNSTAAGADGADIGAVELQMLGGPGRTTPCILPTPPPPPPPNVPAPAATPAAGFDLAAAIKRCKKRFHGKRRKKCIKKARGQARATIAQPGWPEPRSFRDR